MTNQTFHFHREWTLKASPAALWTAVADTNRLDHDLNLPPIEVTRPEDPAAPTIARYRSRLLPLAWSEKSTEWVYPQRYGAERRYSSGPLHTLRLLAELHPTPDGRTQLKYDVWMTASNGFAALLIPIFCNRFLAPRLEQAIAQYAAEIQNAAPTFTAATAPILPPGAPNRLTQIQQSLKEDGADTILVDRLITLVRQGDARWLTRIRPYQLADLWQSPRRAVLELCLLATRAGLLDFQWEMLCPTCRNAGENTYHNLHAIDREEFYCPNCHMDYDVQFDQSVELTFRVNRAIRSIADDTYSLTNPMAIPHIIAQQLLPSGDQRTIAPLLDLGRYRVRTTSLPGAQSIVVHPDGPPQANLPIVPDAWSGDVAALAPQPTLQLENRTAVSQLLLLERLDWDDQITTAAEVTTLQQFRDLFANEALRPGMQISVGQLTIVFTDLRDSTRMYREIGDAPAFGLVLNHFDALREAIAAEGGAIVKTIGDAVMAAFWRPASALRAMMQAQARLMALSSEERPLLLKAALHHGPAIAVNLNERLDYFGSTVNVASRLEKFSQGGDMILSEEVYVDPEVQQLLRDLRPELKIESFVTQIRGYDEQEFCLWRLHTM
ncbi:MAG: hypothetical protein H6662_02020 [Ardenticatenaceae bacterium]|nr:hypothetical protein [Ardenticatenaceae bacterium]